MSVQVTNLRSGSTVSVSLPLLIGEVKPSQHQSTIEISIAGEQGLSWPVHNGRFKALVPLSHGQNIIQLKYYGEVVEFRLRFQVCHTDRFVCPTYIRCHDDEGEFQGLEGQDCSTKSALARITLGAKLLQTFTAEKLCENNFGRKTFTLYNDLFPSEPGCRLFISKLKVNEAREMSGNDLWMHFAKELMSSHGFEDPKMRDKCKWLAYLSFTRYVMPVEKVPKTHSEVLDSTKGHTALGGGGLALYGTGTLHSWAQSLADLTRCFTDTRKVDRTKLMDDSAYREFYWANYSTGLGASLHELGHTFDLAHTPTGVMARGFDDLYRVFLAQPPLLRTATGDNSRSASPVPYSPRDSPLHRPKMNGSGSGSPKPCPAVHPRPLSLMDENKVIQIEAAFRRAQGPIRMTITQNNYDGSRTRKSVARYVDGTEHVMEVTMQSSGEQTIQEHLKHTPSGKTRTTLSLSTFPCHTEESNCRHHLESDDSQGNVVKLNSLLNSCHLKGLQEMRCRDGGAHWYRSSAVLLNYHKWFNPTDFQGTENPLIFKGQTIEAANGIRLIELRSQPEGVVRHHWEFLQENPPRKFQLDVNHIRMVMCNCKEIGILIEDDKGKILKKKMLLDELLSNNEQLCEN